MHSRSSSTWSQPPRNTHLKPPTGTPGAAEGFSKQSRVQLRNEGRKETFTATSPSGFSSASLSGPHLLSWKAAAAAARGAAVPTCCLLTRSLAPQAGDVQDADTRGQGCPPVTEEAAGSWTSHLARGETPALSTAALVLRGTDTLMGTQQPPPHCQDTSTLPSSQCPQLFSC